MAQEIFISTVQQTRVEPHFYGPLSGRTPFEGVVYGGKLNWYLQQVIKLYAGDYLHLEDYVVLDADLVWFQPVHFIFNTSSGASNYSGNVYNYAPSNQRHPPYLNIMKAINGLSPTPRDPYYSGISHHMVFAKEVS